MATYKSTAIATAKRALMRVGIDQSYAPLVWVCIESGSNVDNADRAISWLYSKAVQPALCERLAMRAAIEACTCDSRKSLIEVQLFASESASEYDNQIAEEGGASSYLDEEIALQRRDLDGLY